MNSVIWLNIYVLANIPGNFCFVPFVSFTAWKVSKYGVFSGPYFPAFGLTTKRYGLQSECAKIQTRKNSVFGPFSRSVFCFEHRLLDWHILLWILHFFYWKNDTIFDNIFYPIFLKMLLREFPKEWGNVTENKSIPLISMFT